MRRFPAALAITLTLGLLIIGCDNGPAGTETQPEPTAKAAQQSPMTNSHGVSNVARATADLRPINNSGVSGKVVIEDDGSTIEVVSGSAEGLDKVDPLIYVSLFYDKASAPAGPEACEPGIFAHEAHSDEVRRVNPHPLGEDHPLFLTGPQMLAAYWTGHASDGTGTANDFPSPPAEYVPVDEVGTISIRDLRINEGFGPEAVVACGVVTHAPEGGPPSGS